MTPTVDGSIGAARFPPPPALLEPRWLRRELGKGEALYRVGDPGEAVYRIDEGLLKLAIEAPRGKERIVSIAGPGDLVGALGAPGTCLQESAEALSEQAVVSSIARASFLPQAAEELLAAASVQLGRLRLALEDAELPVVARVARTLLRLGCRFGRRGDGGELWLDLPLTHDHLAAMVGAARETTSSALGQIRAAGLIDGTRGHYHFDPVALERFALDCSN